MTAAGRSSSEIKRNRSNFFSTVNSENVLASLDNFNWQNNGWKDSDGVDEIGGITKSPLGESVNYVNCPMYYDGSSVIAHTTSVKDAANKENIKKMFDVLAVKDNYPVAFHCTQGKDRTGALAYLMETLLDMKTTDIYHDYLFTNMSQIGGYCAYKAFAGYDYYLNQQEGSNLSQKAYNYLLSIGVSATNIDSFISIMTE